MPEAGEPQLREFLTVRELADLLRVRERKVYDLAAAGEVPCSRVTGKLLFPEAAVREWIAAGTSEAGRRMPALFLGSHDPLLEWALRQSRSGLAMLFDGSLDGLDRFAAREGVAAGLHVAEGEGWNVGTVRGRNVGDAVLLAWAMRRRGLVMRAEATSAPAGLADLAGRRIVPRQPESGSQILFDRLLHEAGLSRSDVDLVEPERSEADAIFTVARGGAEVAFGLEALAHIHGLNFVPVVEERFDILVDRRAWFEPPMQRFVAFCGGAEFRAHASGMPGYDLADMFAVRWNA